MAVEMRAMYDCAGLSPGSPGGREAGGGLVLEAGGAQGPPGSPRPDSRYSMVKEAPGGRVPPGAASPMVPAAQPGAREGKGSGAGPDN